MATPQALSISVYINNYLTPVAPPLEGYCTICHIDWATPSDDTVVQTHCAHTFHRACLLEWFNNDSWHALAQAFMQALNFPFANHAINITCPMCRSPCFRRPLEFPLLPANSTARWPPRDQREFELPALQALFRQSFSLRFLRREFHIDLENDTTGSSSSTRFDRTFAALETHWLPRRSTTPLFSGLSDHFIRYYIRHEFLRTKGTSQLMRPEEWMAEVKKMEDLQLSLEDRLNGRGGNEQQQQQGTEEEAMYLHRTRRQHMAYVLYPTYYWADFSSRGANSGGFEVSVPEEGGNLGPIMVGSSVETALGRLVG